MTLVQKIAYWKKLTDIHINANVDVLKNWKALPQEKRKWERDSKSKGFLYTLNFDRVRHVYRQGALCQCDPTPSWWVVSLSPLKTLLTAVLAGASGDCRQQWNRS